MPMPTQEAIPYRPGSDEFDVRASVRRVVDACLSHKLVILASCVLTIGVVFAYTRIWPPIYQASVMVMADEKDDAQRDHFYSMWGTFRKDDAKSEAALMLSKPVAERVVRELGLTYDDVHHSFLSHAGYLWSESWVGKRYRRAKEWLFPPAPMPFAPTPEQIELARTIDDFKSGLRISEVPDTNVGNLTVLGPSPRVAEYANKLIDIYLDERRNRHRQEAAAAYDALSASVDSTRGELLEIEQQLEKYYDENSLLLEFEKDKVEIARTIELETVILEEESAVKGMEKSLARLDADLAAESVEILASRMTTRNQLRESMRAERFVLESQLAGVLLQYREDSRESREFRERIEALDKLIAAESETVDASSTTIHSTTYEQLRQQRLTLAQTLEGSREKLAVKKDAFQKLRERIDRIPEKMRAAHDLGRTQSVLQKKFLLLQEKQMMAEVFLASVEAAPPSIKVVSYASPPAKPKWPKTKLLLAVAGIVGLAAGCGAALTLDTLRGRVTPDRLSQTGAEISVYATLDPGRRRSLGLGGSGGANGARLVGRKQN